MTALATAQGVLRRLLDAVPVAWREDRVFRYAAIGAGITLAVLVIRPGASRQDVQLPPLDSRPAGMPALMPPVGLGMGPVASMPPVTVQKIAPGRPLGDAPSTSASSGDRFGTFTPGRHP